MSHTIFALATAPGRAAVAMVRVSGPAAGAVLRRLAGGLPRPRFAALRALRDRDGALLDHALVLWFPGPASSTGEDCAELHLHGGPAVVDAVTRALLQENLRLAAPGEFTRRAFEHGKLDLVEAEGVGDLVDAESEAQARQALAQMGGALGARYAAWREILIEGLAHLEAAIDFPEEGAGPEVTEAARRALAQVLGDLDAGISDATRGRRVREGYRVAIIGAPNAGKSSLFNALASRDAAIVSETAGTTRDVIETHLDVRGYRVTLADTAGLGVGGDAIEAEGIRRARAWAIDADLRLLVIDRADERFAWTAVAELIRAGDICVLNKVDLPAGEAASAARRQARAKGLSVVNLSAKASPLDQTPAWLAERVLRDVAGGEFPAATRERHQRLLDEGRRHVSRALGRVTEPELAAEDVRLALRALARIVGRADVEDVLGRIFAAFCIGK